MYMCKRLPIFVPFFICAILMKYKVISPAETDALLMLPSSKSLINRALIISHLCGADTDCLGAIAGCDDTEVLMKAVADLKAGIFDIGAAGTAMRFLTALLATTEGEHTVTGTARMRQRPIKILVDALRSLGARVDYAEAEGYPPLHIHGRQLEGGTVELSGSVSSQYISALLLIAPSLNQGLTLRLTGEIVSRPYIDMTLQLMRQWGAEADWTGSDTIVVKPQPYTQPADASVERDWSAAAFWLETVALMAHGNSAGNALVRLPGLSLKGSLQGDSRVAEYYERLGVATVADGTGVVCKACDGVAAAQYAENGDFIDDFTFTPDLAQAVIVTCCLRGIHFHISGLQSLRIKETNRILALQNELRKLGYVLTEQGEGTLCWQGERCEAQVLPVIDTYDDHRMAMAFAPAAAVLGEIVINNPEVVSKSYPTFWDDMRKAGFKVEPIA